MHPPPVGAHDIRVHPTSPPATKTETRTKILKSSCTAVGAHWFKIKSSWKTVHRVRSGARPLSTSKKKCVHHTGTTPPKTKKNDVHKRGRTPPRMHEPSLSMLVALRLYPAGIERTLWQSIEPRRTYLTCRWGNRDMGATSTISEEGMRDGMRSETGQPHGLLEFYRIRKLQGFRRCHRPRQKHGPIRGGYARDGVIHFMGRELRKTSTPIYSRYQMSSLPNTSVEFRGPRLLGGKSLGTPLSTSKKLGASCWHPPQNLEKRWA